MDFAFLGREEGPEKTMAVLVAKEKNVQHGHEHSCAPEDDRYLHGQKGCVFFARTVGWLHGVMVVKSD